MTGRREPSLDNPREALARAAEQWNAAAAVRGLPGVDDDPTHTTKGWVVKGDTCPVRGTNISFDLISMDSQVGLRMNVNNEGSPHADAVRSCLPDAELDEIEGGNGWHLYLLYPLGEVTDDEVERGYRQGLEAATEAWCATFPWDPAAPVAPNAFGLTDADFSSDAWTNSGGIGENLAAMARKMSDCLAEVAPNSGYIDLPEAPIAVSSPELIRAAATSYGIDGLADVFGFWLATEFVQGHSAIIHTDTLSWCGIDVEQVGEGPPRWTLRADDLDDDQLKSARDLGWRENDHHDWTLPAEVDPLVAGRIVGRTLVDLAGEDIHELVWTVFDA